MHQVSPPPHPRDAGSWIPLAIALALLVTLLGMRWALGAGFGLGAATPDPAGLSATGIVEYPEDNFAYVSHVEQARRGDRLLANPFAIDSQGVAGQDNIYLNPLFLVLGELAALFGVRSTGALVLAGLLAACASVLLVYRIALRLGLPVGSARCGALLLAFGSGVSAVTGALVARGADRAASSAWIGVDRTHQDTIGFSTFAVYPFQAVTLAVLALAILLALRALDQRSRGRDLVALAVVVFVSGLLRPYECLMFIASLGAFALCAMRTGRASLGEDPKLERARRVRVTLTAGLAFAPTLAYAVWMTRQPAWREYAEITIAMLDIPRLAWLPGYGMFLPAALLGAIAPLSSTAASRHRDRRPWFSIWCGALLFALVVVNIDQVKLSSGMQLPLAVLAGHGVFVGWRWIERREHHFGKQLARLLGGLACLGFLPTTLHLVANVYHAHRIDAEIVRAADWIDGALARERPVRVLCDADVGRVLPGLVRARVMVGHWSMTPQRDARLRQLLAAGIERDARGVFADVPADPAAFVSLVRAIAPDFLLLERAAPAFSFARARGWQVVDSAGVDEDYGLLRRVGE